MLLLHHGTNGTGLGDQSSYPQKSLSIPYWAQWALWNVSSDLTHGLGEANTVVRARLRAPV